MKKLTKLALVTAVLFAGSTSASQIQLDLTQFGGNAHDIGTILFPGAFDADFVTESFSEFAFSGLWATSVYDLTDGSIAGNFYDTNIQRELVAAGIPLGGISGNALDGTTPISLRHSECNVQVGGVVSGSLGAGAECDVDALNPIAPPNGGNAEGFGVSWDFQVEYHFDGILGGSGPNYTGGFMNVYFNSRIDNSQDKLAFSANLTHSTLDVANLGLFFDITFAEADFLNFWGGSDFVDVADTLGSGGVPRIVIDTNVNPPIPTSSELLLVGNNGIRQSTLDGSMNGVTIPEPGSIALIGLGLFGLGMSARRKS